jgi:hypothetical protein
MKDNYYKMKEDYGKMKDYHGKMNCGYPHGKDMMPKHPAYPGMYPVRKC